MIDQDHLRQIFLANNEGLVVFDGSRWSLYPMPYSKIIRAVHVQGTRVYVGGYGEFGFWEQDQNLTWTYHSLSQTLEASAIKNEEIWNIISRGDDILFQSFGKIFSYLNDQVQEIIPPFSISLIHQVNDRLLLQVNRTGLMEFLPDNTFSLLADEQEILLSSVKFVFPGEDNQEIILGTTNKIYQLQDEQLSSWPSGTIPFEGNEGINRGVVLANGHLAIGTINNGLYILSAAGEILHHFNKANGLQGNNVINLYEDCDQNLWVCSDHGLDLIEFNTPLLYFVDQSGEIGNVFAARLWNDYFYVGTNQGLFRSPWNDRANFNFELVESTQGQVWELGYFQDQMICGHNRGTFIVEDLQAHRISTVSGGRAFTPIPNHSNLLLQGNYNGLSVLEYAENTWRLANSVRGLYFGVDNIVVDQNQSYWVTNPYEGLYHFNLNAACDSVLNLRSFSDTDGLPSIHQLTLFKHMGEIKIISQDNLYRYEPLLDSFQLDSSQSFDQLIPIADNKLLQANKYLIKYYEGQDLINQIYTKHTNSTYPVSQIRDSLLLFNQEEGFALWNTMDSCNAYFADIPLQIQKVCYSSKTVSDFDCISGNSSSHDIEAKNRYIIQFQYNLSTYVIQPMYRFKLEGFDAQWSEWTSRTVREYGNLAKGHYTFRVQNNVNQSEAAFNFEILPFWYQSVWAYIGYIFGLLGILYLAREYYQKRLQREMRRMEIQKIRELQRQKLSIQNQQLLSDINNKKIELANYAGSLVRKNDVLLKLKQEIKLLKEELDTQIPARKVRKFNRIIDNHISSEKDWLKFESSFNEIHDDFFKRLKKVYPSLTPGDLKLAAYLKMNLTSKEIASLLNITVRGVENKRYRMRKKLDIDGNTSLNDVLMRF